MNVFFSIGSWKFVSHFYKRVECTFVGHGNRYRVRPISTDGNIRYREVTMKILLEPDRDVQRERFGPDPVLLRKQGVDMATRDISIYKEKIVNDDYMEHAINRIAMELSHFLAK